MAAILSGGGGGGGGGGWLSFARNNRLVRLATNEYIICAGPRFDVHLQSLT